MISSDSQAMGRVGENFMRAVQTACYMKNRVGALPEDAAEVDPKIAYLKKVGYNARISLESRYNPDFETAIKNSYPLMQKYR